MPIRTASPMPKSTARPINRRPKKSTKQVVSVDGVAYPTTTFRSRKDAKGGWVDVPNVTTVPR